MLIKLFLFKLATVQLVKANASVLRCKDNYMHEMQSLLSHDAPEWSLNLITPLQNLFQSNDQTDVHKKLQMACTAHLNYIGCLQQCEKSRARSIVELGQTHWAYICNALKNNQEFQSTILSCWARHGQFISAQCHFHALLLQSSVMDLIQNGWSKPTSNMEELCRTLILYDKCYIEQSDKVCGKKGWKFLLELNTRNARALIKMLVESTDLQTLPAICYHWQHPEEYANWHVRMITQNHSSFPPSRRLALLSLPVLVIVELFVCKLG